MSFEGPPRKGILKGHSLDFISTCFMLAALLFLILGRQSLKITAIADSRVLNGAWDVVSTFEYASMVFIVVYQVMKKENILTFLGLLNRVDEQVN